jgi:hypothetical protein
MTRREFVRGAALATAALVSGTPPPPTRTKVMTSMPAGTRVTMAAVATAPSGAVSLEAVPPPGW